MKLRRLIYLGIASASVFVGTPIIAEGTASAVVTDCAQLAGNYNNWLEEANYWLDQYNQDRDIGDGIKGQQDIANYQYAQNQVDYWAQRIAIAHCP